jgi:hypothetical protein
LEVKNSHFQKAQISHFQLPPFEKKDEPSPWKKSHFFGSHFSCERGKQPTFKFDIDSEVLFIYRLIPREFDFLGRLTVFGITPVSRFLGAYRRVHGRIQHKSACFWVSVD